MEETGSEGVWLKGRSRLELEYHQFTPSFNLDEVTNGSLQMKIEIALIILVIMTAIFAYAGIFLTSNTLVELTAIALAWLSTFVFTVYIADAYKL